MVQTQHIKDYILFLKREHSLSVTLHTHGSDVILKRDLIAFNLHESPYCVYVKSCPAAQAHCIAKQEKVVEKCKNGPFLGTCHAGVKEWVYPIFDGETTVGFVSVSGYQDERGDEYVRAVSNKYDLPIEELRAAYKPLKRDLPSKQRLDTLIFPLCHMLELAHLKCREESNAAPLFIQRVVRYIKKNYTQNITSETLCKEFFCSRSHLSHVFNAQMGQTLKQYLHGLRVESAKTLLSSTQLSVAEIALSVGFLEPNYFCAVFKKATSLTPSAYRKACRKK